MLNGKHDYGDALLSLQPEGQWTFTDIDDFSSLTWHTTEITLPTKEELSLIHISEPTRPY